MSDQDALIRSLRDVLVEILAAEDLVYLEDCGPPHEGWRSAERLALWSRAEQAVANAAVLDRPAPEPDPRPDPGVK
jgi:hypothetical protein